MEDRFSIASRDFLSFVRRQAFSPGDKFLVSLIREGCIAFGLSFYPLIRGHIIVLP